MDIEFQTCYSNFLTIMFDTKEEVQQAYEIMKEGSKTEENSPLKQKHSTDGGEFPQYIMIHGSFTTTSGCGGNSMNRILNEIKKIIESNTKLYLPHVKSSDLENNGEIYYMNGKDGTEFDWYVNDKLPPFMVFYNDEANLGAMKLLLYKDGGAAVYIYDEKGKKLVKEVHTDLDATETEIFELAVILRNEADNHNIWGAGIESINTDIKPGDEKINEFKENEKNYNVIRNRKNILNLRAYVSKKITEEGWKVGYMERNEPYNEQDSGWAFFAGNEDEKYMSDYRNIDLLCVGNVWQQFDPDIFKYIDMPIGTKLIRISPEAFEMDKNDKKIYMVKR